MLSELKSLIREPLERHLGVPKIEFAMERLAKQGFAPSLIFDVGAYHGEYAQMCRGVWGEAHIACFEPQTSAVDKLKKTVDNDMTVHEFLLGASKKDDVVFHEVESASSVLKEHIDQSHPTSRHSMRTVDSVVETDFDGNCPDLLKLDVQGYELEVLRGSQKTLSSIKVILAEVNLLDIHQDVPLLAEVTEWLRKRNFVAFDVCGLTRRPLDGALWQIDMIFVPRDSPLREDKRYAA